MNSKREFRTNEGEQIDFRELTYMMLKILIFRFRAEYDKDAVYLCVVRLGRQQGGALKSVTLILSDEAFWHFKIKWPLSKNHICCKLVVITYFLSVICLISICESSFINTYLYFCFICQDLSNDIEKF